MRNILQFYYITFGSRGYTFHGTVFLTIGNGLNNAFRNILLPIEIVVNMFIIFLIPPSLKMLLQDDKKCQQNLVHLIRHMYLSNILVRYD